MSAPPLILTLALDAKSFALFDRLRRLHFPPERNFIPAHLTLFHHLPGDEAEAIRATLLERCRSQETLRLTASGLRFLGRGVAYALTSPDLIALRADLAKLWADWLKAQDRQRLQPHVTIQNKVGADRARALFEALQAEFSPFTIRGEGLLLWHYLGGPWEAVETFPFRGGSGETAHPPSD